jgi:hypothetical protein
MWNSCINEDSSKIETIVFLNAQHISTEKE